MRTGQILPAGFVVGIKMAKLLYSGVNWSAEANKLHQNIRDHTLWSEGSKVLLAFSGGRDSVFLCHLLLELQDRYQLDITLIRFNHGLRPAEDEQEDDWCRHFAQTVGLPLQIHSLPVKERAEQNDLGIEANARQLRYDLLSELRTDLDAGLILTAHHRDDQVETLLYRLLSGAEFMGLQGIQWLGPLGCRPILNFNRSEINAYLEKHGIEYLDDSSNEQAHFKRNKIRLELLPLIEKMGFTSFSEALLKSAQSFNVYKSGLEAFVSDFLQRHITADENRSVVQRSRWLDLPPESRVILLDQLLRTRFPHIHHVSRRTRSKLLQFIEQGSTGKSFSLGSGLVCTLDRDRCIFSSPQPAYEPFFIDKPGEYPVPGVGTLSIEKRTQLPGTFSGDACGVWFPAEILKEGLSVRPWEPGDRLIPWGSTVSHKVSNILTKEKLPVLTRRVYPVLLSGDRILWIPCVKRSRFYQLTAGNTGLIFLNFRINYVKG